jgi:hypothetical protein
LDTCLLVSLFHNDSDQTLVSTNRLTAGEHVRPCHRTKHPIRACQTTRRPATLLSPGDELLKGSGQGRFFGECTTHPEGSIEQLLVEGKIRGYV